MKNGFSNTTIYFRRLVIRIEYDALEICNSGRMELPTAHKVLSTSGDGGVSIRKRGFRREQLSKR